jgi:cysteine sulfinate desulfinase/cysteine desulfurase-like protein
MFNENKFQFENKFPFENKLSLDRFGIGRFTTEDEIDYTVEKLVSHVQRLREMRLG